MAEIDMQDSLVWVNGQDRKGRLVYTHGRLVGVLVQLNEHDGSEGKWFLEAGFGPALVSKPPVFDALTDAETWLKERIERTGRPLD